MILADVAQTEAAGAALAAVAQIGDVIALSGPLGAGKTALARGFIRALGFNGDVPSPTFALVVPYAPPEVRTPVTHVDLYRIEDQDEFAELGLDEARATSILLVEWPERLRSRLWTDALQISLAPEGSGRCLTAQVPPSWEGRWPLP
ncbi:MAG: tRNA (adenosine(37)-N6)-threonylcarbamoyltransferase complex ATPase subunit type 1 TsaE [Sphingomonadaceae bacterium]